MFQYLSHLEKRGFTFEISSFFDECYVENLYVGKQKNFFRYLIYYSKRFSIILAIATQLKKFDAVWIEKEAFPYLPAIFERLILVSGTPYILDYDDAIFHNYDGHRIALVRWLLGSKLNGLLQKSSAVLAGNKYLADYASQHGAQSVHFIPTVVDTARYDPNLEKEASPMRVGWIGTPYTARYLADLLPGLTAASKKADITLVTIGSPYLEAPAGLSIEQHEWTEETESGLLASLHVGIMPLPDEPFERGKCGYKLIQYMASGCAVIGSPVGVNCQIVTGDVGYLAKTNTEWAHALVALSSDPIKRRIMGENGRKKIEIHYSLNSILVKIENVLNKVIGMKQRAQKASKISIDL